LDQELESLIETGSTDRKLCRQIVMDAAVELTLVTDFVEQADISYLCLDHLAQASPEHERHEVCRAVEYLGVALHGGRNQVSVAKVEACLWQQCGAE